MMALLKKFFFRNSFVSSATAPGAILPPAFMQSSVQCDHQGWWECRKYRMRFSAFPALTKNRPIFRNTINIFGLLSILIIAPAYAFDIANGKTLHDENCLRCHQASQYTRENSIINNYEELRERISQCELSAEMAWFDEEIDDVTAYLNDAFYHFKMPK